MILTKMKAVAITLLVIGAVATAVIGATQIVPEQEEINTASRAATEPTEQSAAPAAQPASPKGKTAKAKGSAASSPAKKAQSPANQGGAGAEGGYAGGMADMMGDQAMMGGGAMMEEAGVREAVEFQNRLEIAQLAAALTAIDKNQQNQAVLRSLQQPIALSFANPTPLEDVLRHLKQATTTKTASGIPIHVDPLGLKAAEVTPKSTVIIDLAGIPLKTSLRLLLKQLGLAYCVRDGVLIISSVQGIREELAEAARELLGSGNEDIDMRLLNRMGILGTGGMGGGMMQGRPGGMM